jgi:hypothetical protein
MISLEQFCSTEEFRTNIHKPFSWGAFTYATNARIMVRVPRRPDVPEEIDAPPERGVEKYFTNADTTEFRSLARVSFPPAESVGCVCCGGPDYECEECEGSGIIFKIRSIRIDKSIFDVKYIEQILSLPAAEFSANCEGFLGAAMFRFDGGLGCVMPMRSEAPIHLGDLDQFIGAEAVR